MIQYKCKSCGGQMKFGGAGGFECPFCGSKAFMTDRDFKGNEEFRKKLLSFYKAEADKKEFDYSADKLWVQNGCDSFVMDNEQSLNIEYMEKYSYNNCSCYVAKESVVYVFDRKSDADRFLAGIQSLTFPEADVKLPRCFPSLKLNVGLKNSGAVLVFIRRPNFYPAEMFAPLPSEHLAWVISRMENICCALAYSGIEYGALCPSSVWINPKTHEGALFGDWGNTRSINSRRDLYDLRNTAILLAEDTRTPKEMYSFLNSEPAATAYADFEQWDRVIENGFGGHKFIKM